jgi:DNA-binding response OmpR family regulator
MDARVVLAEDEEDIGFIVKTKLEHAKIHVTWKKNGNDAWAAIVAEKPALAILDVDMPGIDGFEVLSRIKGTYETQDIPVIMLTAQGHEAYLGNAMRKGASDYVVKPFQPADVLARVLRLLAKPAAKASG